MQEDVGELGPFFEKHFRKMVTAQDWVDSWKYAQDTYNVNQNPDLGIRDDVIGDDKILAAVQAAKAADGV